MPSNHTSDCSYADNIQLFGTYRGDEYLSSTLPDRRGTTFWSVVRNKASNEIIIKVPTNEFLVITFHCLAIPRQIANTGTSATPFTFNLPFSTVASTGTVQILSGTATASNTPTNPNAIVPRNNSVPTGKTFSFNAGPVSLNVITFVAY